MSEEVKPATDADNALTWEDAGSARGAKWLYLLICWGTIHAAEWMSR